MGSQKTRTGTEKERKGPSVAYCKTDKRESPVSIEYNARSDLASRSQQDATGAARKSKQKTGGLRVRTVGRGHGIRAWAKYICSIVSHWSRESGQVKKGVVNRGVQGPALPTVPRYSNGAKRGR